MDRTLKHSAESLDDQSPLLNFEWNLRNGQNLLKGSKEENPWTKIINKKAGNERATWQNKRAVPPISQPLRGRVRSGGFLLLSGPILGPDETVPRLVAGKSMTRNEKRDTNGLLEGISVSLILSMTRSGQLTKPSVQLSDSLSSRCFWGNFQIIRVNYEVKINNMQGAILQVCKLLYNSSAQRQVWR